MSDEAAPPRKKRRSKWDVAPSSAENGPAHVSAPPLDPSGVAAAAAAKLNAMLAAQGKLVKPAQPPPLPTLTHSSSSAVHFPPPPAPPPPSSHAPSPLPRLPLVVTGLSSQPGTHSVEVVINDHPQRLELTKAGVLTEINRLTGAYISVRGVYLPPGQTSTSDERPLYLHVQAATLDKVNDAVQKLNKISDGGCGQPLPHAPPLMLTPPVPVHRGPAHSGGLHYIQDKVFVGLEHAPSSFSVKDKLEGAGGAYLSHIASQTGSKVFLRGRGSGYTEPTSGRESFEALHIYISHSTQEGLTGARKLCESLISTVQQECERAKMAASSQAPLGFGPAPGYLPPPPRTSFVNPYHQHAPPYPPPPPPPGTTFPPPHPHHPPPPGAAPYPSYYPPHPPPPHAGGFYGVPPGDYRGGPPPPPPPPPPSSQFPLPSYLPPSSGPPTEGGGQSASADPSVLPAETPPTSEATPTRRRFTEKNPASSNGSPPPDLAPSHTNQAFRPLPYLPPPPPPPLETTNAINLTISNTKADENSELVPTDYREYRDSFYEDKGFGGRVTLFRGEKLNDRKPFSESCNEDGVLKTTGDSALGKTSDLATEDLRTDKDSTHAQSRGDIDSKGLPSDSTGETPPPPPPPPSSSGESAQKPMAPPSLPVRKQLMAPPSRPGQTGKGLKAATFTSSVNTTGASGIHGDEKTTPSERKAPSVMTSLVAYGDDSDSDSDV